MELSCTYSALFIIKGNDMQELIDNVLEWAKERNIIEGSTASKQLEKTAAELIELAIAVGRDDMHTELGLAEIDSYVLEKCGAAIADGIGDVLVTLIIVAEQTGLDIEDCLLVAYSQIKDRKGKMIDGKFVKEEDL
jgi:NTP pyrophosphatase (non-canonical NTP hydrolase)